jgi:hypothetical protein
VYCNQLLGISRRKAGTVVRCTSCDGRIIVPDAEPEAQAAAAGQRKSRSPKDHEPLPHEVFERNEIDDLLGPFEFDPFRSKAVEPKEKPITDRAPVAEIKLKRQWRWPNKISIGWSLTAILTFVVGVMVGHWCLPAP